MKICSGSSKESLIKYLKNIRGTLSIDCIINNRDTVQLDCTVKGKKLYWTADKKSESIPIERVLAQMGQEGKRVEGDEIVVLSYRGTDPSKRMDGSVAKYITNWYVVEPYDAVPVQSDGTIQYQEKKILLENLDDIGIGIAITLRGKLYFINPNALPSISRYLGCSQLSIRYKEDTLGLCICIAQALANKTSIKVLLNEKERQFLGIVGNVYRPIDTRGFYHEIFRKMSQKGVWDVKQWYASVAVTESYLEWINPDPDDYKFGVAIWTTEINDGYSVYPYIRWKNKYVYLREIQFYHKAGAKNFDFEFDDRFNEIADAMKKSNFFDLLPDEEEINAMYLMRKRLKAGKRALKLLD